MHLFMILLVTHINYIEFILWHHWLLYPSFFCCMLVKNVLYSFSAFLVSYLLVCCYPNCDGSYNSFVTRIALILHWNYFLLLWIHHLWFHSDIIIHILTACVDFVLGFSRPSLAYAAIIMVYINWCFQCFSFFTVSLSYCRCLMLLLTTTCWMDSGK